ncbi:MAG: hypothetical protein LCH73_09400 [Proteobacteria bacterium]|nr:hypothetical protein [Pseudomonadota bacterium]
MSRTWTHAVMGALLLAALAPAWASDITIRRMGAADDVSPTLHGPAFYLKGDGPPEVYSFDAFAREIALGEPLDVVVLGASYANYDGECAILEALDSINSCTTVVIRDDQNTNDARVREVLQQAEIIYFRGGDQCNFVHWKYSAVHEEVEELVERGGGTGGGSAGLAIQGSLAVYDGCTGSTSSPSALADPYTASISFTTELFHWPHLDNVIMDSHFVKRDRMGRLMTFLCRQQALGRAEAAWGLGLTDGGVMLVDRDGIGTVWNEPAYVVLADGNHAGCGDERQPLTYQGFKVWRLAPGEQYDFMIRPHKGYYTVDVKGGTLSTDPYQYPPARPADKQTFPHARKASPARSLR